MTERMTLEQFTRFVVRLAPATEGAIIRGLQAGGLRLVGNVKREISAQNLVDLGELRNSVQFHRVADGSIVTVEAPHAVALEYGARPFTPPLQPLIAWVLRKGLARGDASYGPERKRTRRVFGPENRSDEYAAAERMARGIQRKYRARGFPARAYFRNAFAKTVPEVQAEIDRECVKIGWRATLSARRALRTL
jgi:hypothetical protein